MRRLAAAALLLFAVHTTGAAQNPDGHIDRVARWLTAVMRHEPGVADDAAALVASWSSADVRTLWIDVNVLVQLMRNPRGVAFTVRPEGQSRTQPVRYTSDEMKRLRSLACVAGGRLAELPCATVTAIDAELARLSALSATAKFQGDGDNYILRRGALLHADIAMLIAPAAEPLQSASSDLQRVRLQVADGREIDIGQLASHWELARTLLDYVKPAGRDVAPGRDAMVRAWYRATAAWMQSREDHDTVHLNRARQIFPADPDILFLSGCQHETYASPAVQAVMQTLSIVPYGMKFDVDSEGTELRRAETFFRHALDAAPQMAEARLRLGHVLLLLERPADAAAEVRLGLESTKDPLLQYYGQLFLGRAEETLGNLDAARAAYADAGTLYPAAQSPDLAVSALARRRGDRKASFQQLQRVFALRPNDAEREDPWWTYHVAQARNATELLDQLRRPFARAEADR